jgi:hypothetical protein
LPSQEPYYTEIRKQLAFSFARLQTGRKPKPVKSSLPLLSFVVVSVYLFFFSVQAFGVGSLVVLCVRSFVPSQSRLEKHFNKSQKGPSGRNRTAFSPLVGSLLSFSFCFVPFLFFCLFSRVKLFQNQKQI